MINNRLLAARPLPAPNPVRGGKAACTRPDYSANAPHIPMASPKARMSPVVVPAILFMT